jgi:hypothetical protein
VQNSSGFHVEPTLGDKPPLIIDDVNFVYMDLGYRNVYLCDGWLAQTRGGIDFWARADAFVEKKRRGEIQPSSFVLTVLLLKYLT